MNPFDLVNSVSKTKEDILENESDYNAYIINRALSYFPDTIFYAAEMNLHYDIPPRQQYDFYMHSLRPRKRFAKWAKAEKSDDVRAIMDYYKYSYEKARQALDLLSKEDLERIRKSYGGKA